jgi:hypothetical protein
MFVDDRVERRIDPFDSSDGGVDQLERGKFATANEICLCGGVHRREFINLVPRSSLLARRRSILLVVPSGAGPINRAKTSARSLTNSSRFSVLMSIAFNITHVRLDSFWHQSGPNLPHEPESGVLEIKKAASMKDIFCEPSGTRTRDPVIKSHMLYQPELTAHRTANDCRDVSALEGASIRQSTNQVRVILPRTTVSIFAAAI